MSFEQNVSAFVACKIVDYFFSMGKGTVTLTVATFMDAGKDAMTNVSYTGY